MVVNLRILLVLSCAILLKPARSDFSWNGNFFYEVGFKAGETDPTLKKNGCDTTISVVHTYY